MGAGVYEGAGGSGREKGPMGGKRWIGECYECMLYRIQITYIKFQSILSKI